jgi:hypothetical protein
MQGSSKDLPPNHMRRLMNCSYTCGWVLSVGSSVGYKLPISRGGDKKQETSRKSITGGCLHKDTHPLMIAAAPTFTTPNFAGRKLIITPNRNFSIWSCSTITFLSTFATSFAP